MSFFIVAAIATSTVVSVYGQIESGKAEQEELDRQAEELKIEAGARELERKQQLNKVLASNIASLADSGMVMEGTPASISLESAKQIGSSEAMFALSDNLKQAQIKRQGKNARSIANLNATSTLLSGGEKIAGRFG